MKKKGGIKINLISLFFVSILPGILWVWYFYRKDKHNPEPVGLIVKDFIWGILIVLPASFLESPFSGLLNAQTFLPVLFLSTIVIIGVIEEGLKSFTVYRLHYYNSEFNEPLDGIIYGVSVGLGFAAAENLFYTILYGYKVGLIRAILTSLVHASFTGIFGYYMGEAKITDNKLLLIYAFILLSFLHGLYDFLIISRLISLGYTIIFIAVLYGYLISLIKKNLERSAF